MLTPIAGLGRDPEPDDHILYRATSKNRYGKADPKQPMASVDRAPLVVRLPRARRHRRRRRDRRPPDALDQATPTRPTSGARPAGTSSPCRRTSATRSIKLTTVDTYSQFAYEDQELAVDLLPEIEVYGTLMATAGLPNGAPRTSATCDEQELVQQLLPIAYGIARDFYAPGSARDDVRQEALVGLLYGLRAFDPKHGVPLERFVALTVRRQLMTFVTLAHRLKHGPLTDSVRASDDDEGETTAIVETLGDPHGDPHRALVARGDLDVFHAHLDRLSELERRAIIGVAVGASYAEIGGAPDDVTFKRVDNAYERARRKMLAAREAA
jgi:RNA polymerase sigma factor (sigma-70 family)